MEKTKSANPVPESPIESDPFFEEQYTKPEVSQSGSYIQGHILAILQFKSAFEGAQTS